MPTRAVELHEEAAAEYDAAFDWYLARSPDAALKFDAEFDRALVGIAQAPRRWVGGSHNTRRFLLRKFPFLLIYRERTAEKSRSWRSLTPAGNRDTGKSGSEMRES